MDTIVLLVFTAVGAAIIAAVLVSARKRVRTLERLAKSIPGAKVVSEGAQIDFDHAGHRVAFRFTDENADDRHHYHHHSSGVRCADILLDLGDVPRLDVQIGREDLLAKLAKHLVREEEIQIGIPSFDKRFVVYSEHADRLPSFLTPQVCEAIGGFATLATRDAISITLTDEGLRLRTWGWSFDQEHLALMVELGLQIFDGYLDATERSLKPVSPTRCAKCESDLDSDGYVECRWCGARYHRDCVSHSTVCVACGSQLHRAGPAGRRSKSPAEAEG